MVATWAGQEGPEVVTAQGWERQRGHGTSWETPTAEPLGVQLSLNH